MGLGAGLYLVTLVNLLVEERVQPDPARAFRIDLAHEREYRKSGLAELLWPMCDGVEATLAP